ncbi:DUF4259 domain-containing protein [Micromonospora parva]|uniref:DUF4259 domain-containing protein n=1 Tax=Micromonospora parva TaxID=1464048 RepID=UPI0033FB8328
MKEEHIGTWDDGPFDNDSAADWCGDLHDADPPARPAMVRAALTTAALNTGYLDHDDAASAAAAIEASQMPGGDPHLTGSSATTRSGGAYGARRERVSSRRSTSSAQCCPARPNYPARSRCFRDRASLGRRACPTGRDARNACGR